MRARLTSLSGLGRERVCPGSAVLPRVKSQGLAANVGNAVHEVIDRAVSTWVGARGRSELVDVADRWELWGEARKDFERYVRGMGDIPVPQDGLTEVALALLEDGSVVPVDGGRGEYKAPETAILAGTIDAMWCERDGEVLPFSWDVTPRAAADAVLVQPDWKTGKAEHVPPPWMNWQLKGGALLAARYTGARRVLPMLGLIDGGPVRWEYPTDAWDRPLPLDERDFESIDREVRRVAARIRAQDPDHPELVTGTHCTYCPARWACPAHVAAPRAMVQAGADLLPGELTREQAHDLLPLVMTTKKAIEVAEKALRDHVVAHGMITLPDGREWGPKATTTLVFDTGLAFEPIVAALASLVGEDRAVELAHGIFGTSKSALYDAVSAAVDARNEAREPGVKKLTKKSVMDATIADLWDRGVVTERPGVEFEARWPKANVD